MNCESCKEKSAAVPYFVPEGARTRCARIIKRLIIALIITLLVLFATNIGWLVSAANDDETLEVIENGHVETQVVQA